MGASEVSGEALHGDGKQDLSRREGHFLRAQRGDIRAKDKNAARLSKRRGRRRYSHGRQGPKGLPVRGLVQGRVGNGDLDEDDEDVGVGSELLGHPGFEAEEGGRR